jgi:hypothetical protein
MSDPYWILPRDTLNEVAEILSTGTKFFVHHAYVEILRPKKSNPIIGIWRIYEA